MNNRDNLAANLANCTRRSGLIALLVMVAMLGFPATHSVAGQAASPFDATFTGQFAITGDVGGSGLFVVEEAGSGTEIELGDFTYTTSLLQNLARVPAGCGPNSSTGVDGSATLTFAGSQLSLHRTSGAVCFSFPTIQVQEEWVIASGTGEYVGTTGRVSREFVGDVRYGTAAGTIVGVIRRR